jgi:hypothetical protein
MTPATNRQKYCATQDQNFTTSPSLTNRRLVDILHPDSDDSTCQKFQQVACAFLNIVGRECPTQTTGTS